MVKESDWHGFSADMLSNLKKWGSLTEGQMGAIKRAYDSIDAKRVERDKAKVANSGEVDISRITELFATASAAGLKRPKFRAEGLTVSKAPDTGRNAGALYVTTAGDTYIGKIANGKFQATGAAAADTLAKLVVIAADPKAAAVAYGRLTGACGCCGRELTDAVSVAAGIGPICETKWGL